MSDDTRRVFKATQDGKAGVEIANDFAVLVGDQRHFIVADDKGITLKGPVSIISDAMGVRRGGLFVGLNDFLHMIPSTIISPIPTQIPFPPISGLVNLAKDVAFFTAMLV